MKNLYLKSNYVLLYLSLISISLSLLSCTAPDNSEKAKVPVASNEPLTVTLDEQQSKEIGLQTGEVKQGFICKTVEATGHVGPNAELSRLVSTPSAGRAIEVRAKLGDIVKQGQIMAVIKSDPIGQVQSDLLQNALQAKSDIQQQEVQLKLSRITFERESKLFGEQVSAKADLQAAENQLEKDNANLASLRTKLDTIITTAQERLRLLGAPANSAIRVVNTKTLDPLVLVRATENGSVIERTINPGELTDGSKQLFTVADLSSVWLIADVFEKDIHDVRKGEEAIVTLDSMPNHTFPAKIIWVGDSINSTTRTLPVRADVANQKSFLKPGMFARLSIKVGQESMLVVPRMAAVQKGDKTLVFIDRGNGNYEQREVQTGRVDPDNIEIKSGLSLGEKVVTRGSTALLGTVMKTAEGKGS